MPLRSSTLRFPGAPSTRYCGPVSFVRLLTYRCRQIGTLLMGSWQPTMLRRSGRTLKK
jgi:hypothetical protein